ncbi:PLP-dependent transferase [Rhizoclosmatium globosum]|uniref:PLP-dependent transferase n=1 Tax=Rhizoclosmatium globosum TaxID=329046 RepID=A0A1Y2CMG4_9FUNG|nr:PLP-dependent transferase [Rhizoclosmatium globosum]|eukprot:ORY48137.1 PLP-dependent transferase [Rhizoclosmatium globosum]
MNTKTLFSTDDPDFVAFQYGAPGKEVMPTAVMTAASTAFWSAIETNYTYLQYGPALGDIDFLTSLQSFLKTHYNDASVHTDSLALTSGASQSFSNILTLFTTESTKVIIENPTYFLALNVLEDHGFKKDAFLNVPTDEDGLDVGYLEKLLERESVGMTKAEGRKYSFLMYLVPTYSNPTGRSTSEARRERIVALARKYDVLVVCDDVYQLLPLTETQPPRRLVYFDGEGRGKNGYGNVISNNSFSKLLAPGLRLGWIEAAPGLISYLGTSGIMNSGGSPNHVTSGLVLSAMQLGGLDSHLSMLKEVYSERMNAMCDYLEQNLPNLVKFQRPKGGFFIWVCLPEGHDAFEIQRAAQSGGSVLYRGKRLPSVKMSYAPGRLFSAIPGSENCLRLTFAFYEKEKLVEGCERLCVLLKQVL